LDDDDFSSGTKDTMTGAPLVQQGQQPPRIPYQENRRGAAVLVVVVLLVLRITRRRKTR